MIKDENHLFEVRDQYENLPFLHRDPEDEKKRLVMKAPEFLERINHYCFAGRQSFAGTRVLVAGGGTGDATIFLAEQLRHHNAQIIHLDMSAASIAVAQRRAEIRGLSNIQWQHHSLLSLPTLDLEAFDYITCTGVLHHLEDPQAGLNALTSVLKPDGALCLMVYGRYGRTGVYQMQDMLKLINRDVDDLQQQVANARWVLEHLPDSNWLIRGFRDQVLGDLLSSDANIYDTLMHSHDCAYSIEELYEFVEESSLAIIEFTGFTQNDLSTKALYRPDTYFQTSPLNALVTTLPKRQQQAITELYIGNRSLHTFYAARGDDRIANFANLDNIPFFFLRPTSFGQSIAQRMERDPGTVIEIDYLQGNKARVPPTPYGALIFKYLDGLRSTREIFNCVRMDSSCQGEPTDATLMTSFKVVYDACNLIDLILLRHSNVRPPPL